MNTNDSSEFSNIKFSALMEEYRTKNRQTYDTMANCLQTTKTTVANWCKGYTTPDIKPKVIKKISSVIGKSEDCIIQSILYQNGFKKIKCIQDLNATSISRFDSNTFLQTRDISNERIQALADKLKADIQLLIDMFAEINDKIHDLCSQPLKDNADCSKETPDGQFISVTTDKKERTENSSEEENK